MIRYKSRISNYYFEIMKDGEEIWEKHPVYSIVYSIVQREKTITFKELVDKVQEENPDIGTEKVRSALVKLEIWDKVDVVSDGKETRITLRG